MQALHSKLSTPADNQLRWFRPLWTSNHFTNMAVDTCSRIVCGIIGPKAEAFGSARAHCARQLTRERQNLLACLGVLVQAERW